MSKIFVAADWVNLEGRLTAHFSGDATLQRMLDEELEGGHKVHAQTAALIYNIDPGDAKKHTITLQGNEVSAYYGGKRGRHMFHYGGKARKMAQTFWISLAEAERIYNALANAHPGVVQWWDDLADEVFGRGIYTCNNCGRTGPYGDGVCQHCEQDPRVRYKPRWKWQEWEIEPSGVLYTPFKRRRIYMGTRGQSMNALISQRPQSSGASMWYRTLMRLHGLDPSGDRWPVLPGTRVVWTGSYDDLVGEPRLVDVATGTYDSFVLACDDDKREDVIQWLAWTMEQAWPELGGLRIPAEVEVGLNWGSYHEQRNPDGIRAVDLKPFQARCPDRASTADNVLMPERLDLRRLLERGAGE